MGEVRVLYFATARAAAGTSEELISFAGLSWDQDSFWMAVIQRHPTLSAQRGSIRLARNCEYLESGGTIHSGDDIALIPPVSGG